MSQPEYDTQPARELAAAQAQKQAEAAMARRMRGEPPPKPPETKAEWIAKLKELYPNATVASDGGRRRRKTRKHKRVSRKTRRSRK